MQTHSLKPHVGHKDTKYMVHNTGPIVEKSPILVPVHVKVVAML